MEPIFYPYPMSNPILKFRNKLNASEITEPIQVDVMIGPEAMKSLLNTVLMKESDYIFYYKEERITTELSVIVQKYELSLEEEIIIEYIDNKEVEADKTIECDDVVKKLCVFQEKVYYLTYSGDVFELEYIDDTSKSKNKSSRKKTENKKFIGLFSDERLLGFTNNEIYDILENEVIHTSEEEIRCCASIEKDVVVSTSNSIYLISEYPDRIVQDKEIFPRRLEVTDNHIYWLQEYDKFCTFDRSSRSISSQNIGSGAVCFSINNREVHIGTSNNTIVKIRDNLVKKYQIPTRYISQILTYQDSITCVSQHSLFSILFDEKDNLVEKGVLIIPGQINSIIMHDNRFYIANDNKISIFSMERLKI